MAFRDFIAHLDARVRAEPAGPIRPGVLSVEDALATWTAGKRSVRAELEPSGKIEYYLLVAGETYPYDRFADDLFAPDLATTARKIAAFFALDDDPEAA